MAGRLTEAQLCRWRSGVRPPDRWPKSGCLQHNICPWCRRPQTLAALSEALGWPADYLAAVLRGGKSRPHPDEQHDPVLTALNSIERDLADLRQRVGQIGQQIGQQQSGENA